MTPRAVWLSVDFDFFVPEVVPPTQMSAGAMDEPVWPTPTLLLNSAPIHHGEVALAQPGVWRRRETLYRLAGGNLRRAMGLHRADPHPRRFWSALERRGFTFDGLKRIVVADSHRFAFRVFDVAAMGSRAGAEVQLVNFDAHHDLLYSMAHLEYGAAALDPTCENWALFTLLQHDGLHGLTVYPTWRGLDDWNQTLVAQIFSKPGATCEAIQERITACASPCVWPGPEVRAAAGPVELLFLARSGAWTPPWHDGAFLDLCEDASARYGCPIEAPFVDEEGIDPREARIITHKLRSAA